LPFRTYRVGQPCFTLAPGDRQGDANAYVFTKPVLLYWGQLWFGYEMGALLEGNVYVYLNRANGESIYLGGFYLHKHTPWQTRQDFIKLEALRDLGPLQMDVGDAIQVDRDIKNIDSRWFARTVNAWDCELLMIVEY
jgi:hypothetical protein